MTWSVRIVERERLIRYKFRWAEADDEPQDNKLSVDEMKDFRHPEQSSKMIIRMAKDIIDNLGNETTIDSHYGFMTVLHRGFVTLFRAYK